MGASEDVEFCGVYEPSEEVKEWLGQDPVYEGVHWFESKEEFLEDETIQCIACQGLVSENLAFAREALEHGNHVWLDKPAGDDLDEFRSVLDIAEEKGLLVQLGYMFRYNAAFQFIQDWAKAGKFGEIYSVRARMSSGPDTDDSHWRRWDSRGERQGGIMQILIFRAITLKQTAESCQDPPAA